LPVLGQELPKQNRSVASRTTVPAKSVALPHLFSPSFRFVNFLAFASVAPVDLSSGQVQPCTFPGVGTGLAFALSPHSRAVATC
jgi:hypothetical protein